MTLTFLVFKTHRREVALEYELLQNKQNVRDLQEGIKQAAAVHIIALHESKTKLR
jgi:hypothetical protein